MWFKNDSYNEENFNKLIELNIVMMKALCCINIHSSRVDKEWWDLSEADFLARIRDVSGYIEYYLSQVEQNIDRINDDDFFEIYNFICLDFTKFCSKSNDGLNSDYLRDLVYK